MNQQLFRFIAQFGRVVLVALVPVILTAFLSIPFNLEAFPGDPNIVATTPERGVHLT